MALCRRNLQNKSVKSVPLQILDKEMLHQIPFKPKLVEDRINAAGIRAAVRVMPTTDGGRVLPNPQYAPLLTPSQHMNIWENPRIVN